MAGPVVNDLQQVGPGLTVHGGHAPVIKQQDVSVFEGDRDPLPQPDAAARAAYLESNTQRLACRIVLDASHWVAYEQPDTVNRLMIEFFTARGTGNAEGLFL